MGQQPLDFSQFVLAVLAIIVSKDVAAIAGPYIAIVTLAAAGSAISLSTNEGGSMTVGRALWFILSRMLLAIVVTVFIAEIMQKIIPWAEPRYSFSVIALGIGYTRDFKALFAWIVGLGKGAAERWAASKGDGEQKP